MCGSTLIGSYTREIWKNGVSYIRRWLFLWLQALLINKQGQSMVVDGPQRVSVFRRKFERLTRLSADQYQYIRVQKTSGEVEHMPG